MGQELAFISAILNTGTRGRALFYKNSTFAIYELDNKLVTSGNYSVTTGQGGWCHLMMAQDFSGPNNDVCSTFLICETGILSGCERPSSECYPSCTSTLEWAYWFSARPIQPID